MPFRWFKRHEKTLMYFVAFFIMPTFLIGTGAFFFFSSLGAGRTQVSYSIVPGERTGLDQQELGRMSRIWQTNNISELALIDAELREAELAGIYASDRELSDRVNEGLQQAFPNGYTMKEYRDAIGRSFGLTVSQYEERERDTLIRMRLQGLKALLDPNVNSRRIYQQYSRDHQELELHAVAFEADDFLDQVLIEDFSKEEVEEFYTRMKQNPQEYSWAVEEYMIPEQFDLEVVFLELEGIDESLSPEVFETGEPPTEDEMRAFYERHLDWYTPEAQPSSPEGEPADPQDESGAGEEPGTDPGEEGDPDAVDDSDAPESEEAPEPIPFEDVQDEVRRRILAERAFEGFLDELLEKRELGDVVDLREFAGTHGVFYHLIEKADADALVEDGIIGFDDVYFELQGLQPTEYSRGVIDTKKDVVYLFRLRQRYEPDFKSEQVVSAQLREDLRIERSRELAKEAAEELYQEMVDRVHAQIREEWSEGDEETPEPGRSEDSGEQPGEREGTEGSGDEAGEQEEGGEDPTEGEGGEGAEKTSLQQPAEPQDPLLQAELDGAERSPRMGDVFDAVVEERGLERIEVGPTEVLRIGTEKYENEEDLATRFLLSRPVLATFEPGRVEWRSMYDRTNHTAYVVKVVSRENPPPWEMTKEDYERYRDRLMSDQGRMFMVMQQQRMNEFIRRIDLGGPAVQPASPAPPRGSGPPR